MAPAWPRPGADRPACVQVLIAYMTLLKTISSRLTPSLVGLFFQGVRGRATFPLYAQAIAFVSHRSTPPLPPRTCSACSHNLAV